MSDSHITDLQSDATVASLLKCEEGDDCCSADTIKSVDGVKIDGAGEPCPTPLLWQEIREHYLSDSSEWELEKGPHRLVGRSWGHGRPLYFLNNFAATSELFCLTAWLLRDEFRCVTFDTFASDRRKGSQKPVPTMADFADDLVAVADQWGDERFVVYGAAFGAAVALQLALNHPQRLDRMVLQHGFAARRLSMFERFLASVCLHSRGDLNTLPQRRRFQAVNHQPWFPPYDHSRFDFLVESTGSLSLQDLAQRGIAVNQFNVVSRLGEIEIPTLLLRTEGEGKVAAESQELLERDLKHARTEWMHSAGQHPYLTHPHRIAKLMKSFCEPNLLEVQ